MLEQCKEIEREKGREREKERERVRERGRKSMNINLYKDIARTV